jgi:hypothetical protein
MLIQRHTIIVATWLLGTLLGSSGCDSLCRALGEAPGCFGVSTPVASTSSTVVFKNETSATTVGQILYYNLGDPLRPSHYLDVTISPGESYSFQAPSNKGTIYICPKLGEGHGCLRDFYIDDPLPGGTHEVRLTDSNCLIC